MPSKYRKRQEKKRARLQKSRASGLQSTNNTISKNDSPVGQPVNLAMQAQSVSTSSSCVAAQTLQGNRHPTANNALVSISESSSFTAATPHHVLSGEIHIEALDEFSVLAGLIPPQTLYYAVLSGCASLKELEIDESVFAVQIHYITGHYVVSHQNELGIFVFDSKPYTERVVDLLPQLLLLYKKLRREDNPAACIQYKISQLQGNTNDCGVFAAANAINLLRSIDPCSVMLDTAQLRNHLYNCLVTKTISPFPSLSAQVSGTPWMSQYFNSQLSKETLRKQQQRSVPSFRKREQSRDASRHAKRRNDTEYRAHEQKRNTEQHAARRLDAQYRDAEQKRNTAQRAARRLDAQYKDAEQERDTQRRAAKRLDTQYRDAEQKRDTKEHSTRRLDSKYRQAEQKRNTKEHSARRADANYRKAKQKCDTSKHSAKRQDEEFRKKEQKRNTVQHTEKRSHKEYRKREQARDTTRRYLSRKKNHSSDPNSLQKNKGNMKEIKSNSAKKLLEHAKNTQRRQPKRKDSKHCINDSARQSKGIGVDLNGIKQDQSHSIASFRKAIENIAYYSCISCSRLLLRSNLSIFNSSSYSEKLLTTCQITPCKDALICTQCKSHLKTNKIPPLSAGNFMQTTNIPAELDGICSLEERLFSLKIPFMKIISLKSGSQRAVSGAVVNVPSNICTTIESLPRTPTESGIIPVKLKRRLCYKGHVLYQHIRPERVRNAVAWLRLNNPRYYNVNISSTHELLCEDETELVQEDICGTNLQNCTTIPKSVNNNRNSNESDEEVLDEDSNENLELRGLPFDTCLQYEDGPAGSSSILDMAPAEGNTPISVFMDKDCEVESFPTLFPDGRFGYNFKRPTKLSPKKYYSARLTSKDPRFATSTEYIFFAQFYCELKALVDNISVALRKKNWSIRAYYGP